MSLADSQMNIIDFLESGFLYPRPPSFTALRNSALPTAIIGSLKVSNSEGAVHSSLAWDVAQLKYQKSYPKQTKTNSRLIGTKSSHRDNKIKIYRDFLRDIGPNRSKVGPNGQISSFLATDFILAQNKGF